jgi:uncharacterized YccA/Bax inhibitor family protein
MTNNTLFVGLALVLLGLYGYFHGVSEKKEEAKQATLKARETDPNAADVQPEVVSKTALIPAGVGAVFLLCVAAIVWNNNWRKHVMHLAVVVGVIGVIGGFMPVMRSGLDWSKMGVKIGLFMSLICAVFVGLCVKSFVDARKARESGKSPE